jgi:Zn-dependent peptidase ImmA (M78 family)
MAHELGHFLDKTFNKTEEEIIALTLNDIRQANQNNNDLPDEHKADLIAHRLLMPSYALMKLMAANMSRDEMREWFGVSELSIDNRLEEVRN